ncbi:hypothetical protein [Pseudonocardia sp. NPDC046786]
MSSFGDWSLPESSLLVYATALLLGCGLIAWSTTGRGQRRRSSS